MSSIFKKMSLTQDEKHKIYSESFHIEFSPVNWRKNVQLQILDSFYRLSEFRLLPHRGRMIIVMTDETEFHGLADRIRTMLAGYALAAENNLRFFIYHTAGFVLEKYLEPNKVKWTISERRIARGLNRVKTLWFPEKWPLKLARDEEYHGYRLYTLWGAIEKSGQYTFLPTFQKLFRPSAYLQNLVDSAIKGIGYEKGEYVVFHLRFLNFFEQVEANGKVTSTEEQRRKMIEDVHATMDAIMAESDCKKAILFSDSNLFLEEPHPDYVRVLPGAVGHVYAKAKDSGIADKAFCDLFVMSHAKMIFSIVGENIYGGTFSRTAAVLGTVPFKQVPIIQKS